MDSGEAMVMKMIMIMQGGAGRVALDEVCGKVQRLVIAIIIANCHHPRNGHGVGLWMQLCF